MSQRNSEGQSEASLRSIRFGVVGYFSNNRAVETAQQLEAMGESNNLSGAQDALSTLEKALNQLTPALAAFELEYE